MSCCSFAANTVRLELHAPAEPGDLLGLDRIGKAGAARALCPAQGGSPRGQQRSGSVGRPFYFDLQN